MHGHDRRLVLAVSVNVLAFVFVLILGILLKASAVPSPVEVVFPDAPVAEARIRTDIISPEIVPAAQLRDDRVQVRGVIVCTAGQTLLLRVTVTQGSTTGSSEVQATCTGDVQPWAVPVTASGGATFATGAGAVHVWSKTVDDGDEHEWDRPVRIAWPGIWLPLIEGVARPAPADR